MKRITPLNIVMAILLIWLGFGLIDKTLLASQALWVLLLVVISIVGDQLTRVSIRDLKRIWMVQMVLIAITMIATFAIWYIKN